MSRRFLHTTAAAAAAGAVLLLGGALVSMPASADHGHGLPSPSPAPSTGPVEDGCYDITGGAGGFTLDTYKDSLGTTRTLDSGVLNVSQTLERGCHADVAYAFSVFDKDGGRLLGYLERHGEGQSQVTVAMPVSQVIVGTKNDETTFACVNVFVKVIADGTVIDRSPDTNTHQLCTPGGLPAGTPWG